MKMKRVVTAVALVFGWAVLVQAEEYEFQQGNTDENHPELGVYEGGQDVRIDSTYSNPPYPPQEELVIRASTSGAEMINALIRFTGLAEALPNAKVQSAKLELTYGVDSPQSTRQAKIEIYTVGKMWHDPNATWDVANGGLPWEASGAQGVTDRLTMHGEPVDMGPRPYPDYYLEGRKFIFPLDPIEVQSWFDNPDSNPGIILVMNSDAKTRVVFHSNETEDPDPTKHPLLRVTAILCPTIPGDVTRD